MVRYNYDGGITSLVLLCLNSLRVRHERMVCITSLVFLSVLSVCPLSMLNRMRNLTVELLHVNVVQLTKDGVYKMDIFSCADSLRKSAEKPIARRAVKARSGVVIRRAGKVIKNTTVPTVKKTVKPRVKKKVVARSEIDNDCIDNFLNSGVRRKALGKYIYEKREQLVRVLLVGYSVERSSVELLSYTDLSTMFSELKLAEAKSVEFKRFSPIDREKRLGIFYDSFEIVSDVTSEINSEHYKLEYVEKKEEEVEEVDCAESLAQKKARNAEWLVRKVVIQERKDLLRRKELKDAGHKPAVIEMIMTGNTEKPVNLAALDLVTRRKVKYQWFIEHGCNHNDAERKTAQWERYQKGE